jgi:amino acid adenylation domain-containing protein
VELSEIEHHLNQFLPSEFEVMVDMVKPKGRADGALLAAFVSYPAIKTTTSNPIRIVSEELSGKIFNAQLEPAELHLRATVPRYMIPMLYIPVNRFPYTMSGKRDRKVLQELTSAVTIADLALSRDGKDKIRRNPSTPVEVKIARIWADVLNLDVNSIFLDDTLIGLGGDSLDAVKIAATAKGSGFALNVADTFKLLSLQSLAEKVENACPEDNIRANVERFSLVGQGLDARSVAFDAAQKALGIPTDAIQDMYPCSPMQEGLITISMGNPGAYVGHFVYRLGSNIDMTRFREAWESVIAANDILRTRIFDAASLGMLQAVVMEPAVWTAADSLERYRQEFIFSMGSQLCRFAIIDQGPDKLFVWTMHHALYDAWSMDKILHEVAHVYVGGTVSQRPRFANFVEYITEMDLVKSREFWVSYLEGCSTSSFPRILHTRLGAPRGVTKSVGLPGLTSSGGSTTLANIVRAAWAILVGSHETSNDVVFGMTFNGRSEALPGILDIIGPTISTVPVRVKLDPEQCIDTFLANVQAEAALILPHEQFGVQGIRSFNDETERGCKFRNILIIQTGQREGVSQGQLPMELMEDSDFAFHNHPLVVLCFLQAEGLFIEIEYDGNKMCAAEAQVVAYQFRHVIEQLTNMSSTSKIKEIEVCSQEDKLAIESWNAAKLITVHDTIPGFIKRQTKERSDAEAVYAWDGSFSYRVLDLLSDCLAIRLQKLGIAPHSIVPVMFKKSKWAIVAMLAVMKSGAAYVGLDPSYPLQRRLDLISQVKARIILADPITIKVWEGEANEPDVVLLDVSTSTPAERDDESLPLPACAPASLAYAVFTSGTTGRPKGIVTTHEAYISSLVARKIAVRLDRNCRVLQFCSFSFDISVDNIFGALMFGGCVCIPSEDERLSDLAGFINRSRVNYIQSSPSIAELLSPQTVPNVETMYLGGDVMTHSIMDTWAGSTHLMNGYGISEASVFETVCHLAPGRRMNPGNIGKAIGFHAYIVDAYDSDRLAPIGATGELVLEGPGLAQGYYEDSAKTEATFIRNPAWAVAQDPSCDRRFLKTGDLVRYHSENYGSGNMIFVARKDNAQVKLRGYRIELSEIEAALAANLPTRGEVAVDLLKFKDTPEPVLAAFINLTLFPSWSCTDIQTSLLVVEHVDILQKVLEEIVKRAGRTLPHYMIPSVLMPLARMPVTANGKKDRKQLRQLAASMNIIRSREKREDELTTSGSCTTDFSRKIRALWASALRIEETSINMRDSFFALGGDSLVSDVLFYSSIGHVLIFV